ncbi:MAG: hypothetical protein AUJ02_07670 [Chloroflexi bacterium 13_1_40CM_3_65_12]|nr:MAG: hypothetical protein AUH40_01740 [Chloroflexi bacterium 13_1_40CM_65_17]OLD24570.1 MAG: hypothetical protein AUJ02_07670 [Chloroflexi bacterium 13_1_40CM_3_65_12]OLD50908.1 MAG: hypothetical protein AUI42_01115 [Actinobacteria bacterium 13_1_40CM_2_65_8]
MRDIEPTQARRENRLVGWWIAAVFGITALGMVPLFIYRVDLSRLTFSSSVPLMLGLGIELTAFAPALAAILVVALFREKRGIRRLLRPVLRWRVGAIWFLVAALGSTLIFIAADATRAVLHAPLPNPWFTFPGFASMGFLVGALLAGAFGEEVGWRGLGQARLQGRFSALSAAALVGVVWTVWHLWPVVAPGGLDGTTWADALLTLVRLTALSVLFAWLYNSTGGSLLIVMVAHAGYDVGVNLVPGAYGNHTDPVLVVLFAAAAITVALVVGPSLGHAPTADGRSR